MLHIVKELPDDVELSEHLRDRADFYLCVQSFGISFYIPATADVRRLLCLDKNGQDVKPDMRKRWWSYDKADALRTIINALELQIRDVMLAGIEENVTRILLDRMDAAMRPTVKSLIDRQVKMLPKPKSTKGKPQ